MQWSNWCVSSGVDSKDNHFDVSSPPPPHRRSIRRDGPDLQRHDSDYVSEMILYWLETEPNRVVTTNARPIRRSLFEESIATVSAWYWERIPSLSVLLGGTAKWRRVQFVHRAQKPYWRRRNQICGHREEDKNNKILNSWYTDIVAIKTVIYNEESYWIDIETPRWSTRYWASLHIWLFLSRWDLMV